MSVLIIQLLTLSVFHVYCCILLYMITNCTSLLLGSQICLYVFTKILYSVAKSMSVTGGNMMHIEVVLPGMSLHTEGPQ